MFLILQVIGSLIRRGPVNPISWAAWTEHRAFDSCTCTGQNWEPRVWVGHGTLRKGILIFFGTTLHEEKLIIACYHYRAGRPGLMV